MQTRLVVSVTPPEFPPFPYRQRRVLAVSSHADDEGEDDDIKAAMSEDSWDDWMRGSDGRDDDALQGRDNPLMMIR